MRRSYFSLLQVVVFLLLAQLHAGVSAAQTAAPAVPRLIRFSGVVRQTGEKPVRGVAELSFSLFKEESGGEPLWFETQTVEVDAQGRYNVLLGAMHPDGVPMDLFISGEARWLSIMVGKAEQPRVLLVSVPYALKAADAESLGGKPANAYVATEQLKTVLSDPQYAQRGLNAMVLASTGGGDTPPALINETVPGTFTCSTVATCLSVGQTGAGPGLSVTANATSGVVHGVRGQTASTSGRGVYGLATATTGSNFGVRGDSASTAGTGVFGYATSTTGLSYGLVGRSDSTSGVGVAGRAVAATGATMGLRGIVDSASGTAGVFESRAGGKILSGLSTGLVEKFSVDGSGNVIAASFTGNGSGLTGIPSTAFGTVTSVGSGAGLTGGPITSSGTLSLNTAFTDGLYARLGAANAFTSSQSVITGIVGATAIEVQATDPTAANMAISGHADGPAGVGVRGEANNGIDSVGVHGISSTGLAGQFDGDVHVIGNLEKSSGSFKIDHPLDPANKYLLHSFVESPDMMNIYNGNVTLDANGEATIELPEWFEALNKDFRYQLTAMGAPGPNLYVSEEIRGNRFRVAGGTTGMKVSWLVTGVRKDAWANAHRIPVEVNKPGRERGFYLHPGLFGASPDDSVSLARHPERMRRTSPR